ncbi:MAG TPA: hypothetical protein VGE07_21340, partial [Herpetosiphonaceae bacterium]
VPPHATAIGVPARVVMTRDPETGTTRRVEQLPDPEGAMLRSLHATVERLEGRIQELENAAGMHAMQHAALFAAVSANGGEGDDPFACLDDDEQKWSPGWGI